jgi:hypothetical protein
MCLGMQKRSFSQFLIRLCGIIGGIFATSGWFHPNSFIIVVLFTCEHRHAAPVFVGGVGCAAKGGRATDAAREQVIVFL